LPVVSFPIAEEEDRYLPAPNSQDTKLLTNLNLAISALHNLSHGNGMGTENSLVSVLQ